MKVPWVLISVIVFLVIIAGAIAIVLSCTAEVAFSSSTDKDKDKAVYAVDGFSNVGIRVVTIEGCEYLVVRYVGGGVAIVHKENCGNWEHRR